MISIQNHPIGEGQRCFIIAEAGVNHNGDLELAKKLIDAAYATGADAIKFQTFVTENLVTESAEKAFYQKENDPATSSQFDMLRKLEFSENDFGILSDYSKKKDIIFLSTAFDTPSIDILSRLGVPVFKIPSGEITNYPYLREISNQRKPVILSTGMSTVDEIREAVSCLKESGCHEIIILHCTTCYPAPLSSVNLKAISTLRDQFRLPVGYSDHTDGIAIPIAAVAMGACVIEKHLTLDRNLPGPDHKASLEPKDFTSMVCGVREVEIALGTGEKMPQDCELNNRSISRKSIIAALNIPSGYQITREMLTIKRPGTGIEPKFLEDVIGKKASSAIKKDSVILWNMIE